MPGPHRFTYIALALLVLLGGTRVLEEVDHARTVGAGEDGARRHAIEAVRKVEASFQREEQDLLRRAARLADDPAIRQALRHLDEAPAIERLLGRSLPPNDAVEIYTPRPELLAWRGPSLPLDPATRRLGFLDTLQSAIVHDGLSRSALAVWHPVREDDRLLGAVRVVRLLRVEVPVQNQYLYDLDVVGGWAMEQTPVVQFALEGLPEPTGEAAVTHIAHGVDGFPLATLAAPLLDAEQIADARRATYRDAAALFAAILMFWLMFGALKLVFRTIGPQGSAPRPVEGLLAGASMLVPWWALRFALLKLGFPLRYTGTESFPAFDPAFIGSAVAGGVAGSAVELAITALFAVFSGVWMMVVGLRISARRRRLDRVGGTKRSAGLEAVQTAVVAVIGIAAVVLAVALVHRATLDATIGYLDRTGPLPEGLVTLAFGAFLLVLLGAMLLVAGLTLVWGIRRRGKIIALIVVSVLVGTVAAVVFPLAPAIVSVVAALTAMASTIWIERHPQGGRVLLGLRGSIGTAVLLSILIYPIVADALRVRERVRLVDHIEDFVDGEDPRVTFALESVLLDARASQPVRRTLALASDGQMPEHATADSLAADLVTGSLLATLADYSVGLTLHDSAGVLIGQYWDEMNHPYAASALDPPPDPIEFERLMELFEEEAGAAGFAVERYPAPDRASRFVFAGIGPILLEEEDGSPVGWITARALPRPARFAAETPFPRVLVPAGLHQAADEERVFAEFRDGVLHRSRGVSFGRFRLSDRAAEVQPGESTWIHDRIDGQPVRVYLQRAEDDRVIAVRMPRATLFDHLYSLLRILTAGLILALITFGIGRVALRSTVATPRQRLRDRVLNQFLLVGLVAVGATGLIGREVIAIQNREAVAERLKRQIARVEATLYEEAGGDQADVPPHLILDRARLDIVGHQLGLDVNLYRGTELVGSSRSQLVRQRLIEDRLPIEVVETLFVRGERYAFTSENIGRFEFTTGYEAIPGPDGRPAAVLGIPTLPEQLAIEADQARMTAYLFGVLLLLLVVIFGVATFLANRLTRPFARLREGLRAVGEGLSPQEPIPVESRDEVGEVIETFNAVWAQLEESRRRLAAQERDLAWREMAQQVAHEIKNPLTPMRLSVQHLRRAYERAGEDMPSDPQFARLLDQISGTLIEQIDALSRIAGEFSRLGELPDSVLERFNLNDILSQAAALVGEEPHAEILLDLESEPLPVRADREELRRVYINLLKNAQQAIPDGERGLIQVSSRRLPVDDGEVMAETRVADTGLGIPKEIRPKVFQPSFSTKTSGMGLGLAIARKTIEDLGGEIDFETETGAGTTFIIRLPIAAED